MRTSGRPRRSGRPGGSSRGRWPECRGLRYCPADGCHCSLHDDRDGWQKRRAQASARSPVDSLYFIPLEHILARTSRISRFTSQDLAQKKRLHCLANSTPRTKQHERGATSVKGGLQQCDA
jgi:hypothetical protein